MSLAVDRVVMGGTSWHGDCSCSSLQSSREDKDGEADDGGLESPSIAARSSSLS